MHESAQNDTYPGWSITTPDSRCHAQRTVPLANLSGIDAELALPCPVFGLNRRDVTTTGEVTLTAVSWPCGPDTSVLHEHRAVMLDVLPADAAADRDAAAGTIAGMLGGAS